jgi:UDP-GlcNAc:undecaprenyl-phosphate GlcNAc-1-phosphate transferase
MISQLVFSPLIFAFITSLAITYITILSYKSIGLVDKSTKKEHPKHIHTNPIPRGGGIPIFVAMLFATLTFIKVDTQIAGIFAGALVITLTGILDDIWDISPYVRLGIGAIAAIIVVSSGIGIGYISNPIGPGVIHFDLNLVTNLITVLWIVWGMNFVNMGAKGLDGQLPGVTMIAAIVMGILSFRFVNDITTWPSAYLSFRWLGRMEGYCLNLYQKSCRGGEGVHWLDTFWRCSRYYQALRWLPHS